MAKSKPLVNNKKPAQTSKMQKPFWAIVIFLFAFFLYSNTFNHGFVLDDLTQIEQNKSVQQGVSAIPEIISTSYRYGYEGVNTGLYRPLSNVTFAIEYSMVGMKPRLYHIDNVWLFALSCVFMFCMLAALFKNWHISFAVAATLLYAAHPLHTEVVANIKSRDELLSFLGLMAMLWLLALYIHRHKNIYLFSSVFIYFITLFSKESTVAYLGVVPLVLYFFSDFSIKKIIVTSLWFVVPAAIFLSILSNILITMESQHYVDVIQNTVVAAKGFGEKSATIAAIMGIYIQLLLWPTNLLSNYSYSYTQVETWSSFGAIISFAIYAGLIAFALYKLKSKSIYSFSIFFFLGTIIMVSNIIITISWTLGERFLYVPSFAFCIALAYALITLSKFDLKQLTSSPITRPVFTAIFSLLMIFYAYQTYGRNKDWKSNLTLFGSDVKRAESNAALHALYAKSLFDEAERARSLSMAKEAEAEYAKAIQIYPYRDFINGLGTVDNILTNYASARNCFLQVLAKCDSIPDYWHNLGIAYQGLQNRDSAVYSYQQALRCNRNYIKSVINLSGVLNELKRYREAASLGRQAAEMAPTAEVYSNLSIFYQGLGMNDSAAYYKAKALSK
jgi:tetratricopeptide (TPR) repeat protein